MFVSTERENKVGHSEAPKRSHFPGCPLRGFQPSGSYPWATDKNRKRWRQTALRQSTPQSILHGNSVPTPEATRTCKIQQNSLQKGSRYGISGVGPENQTKERSVHELFTGAFWNKSSMGIVLVFLRKKHQNSQKWAKLMNFSLWPFLWFGLPGRLLNIVDTDTIADAVFADAVSETSTICSDPPIPPQNFLGQS